MRPLILKLHLYLGLLCAPYLVIFGISSLHFNHKFKFMQTESEPVRWQKTLANTPGGTNDQQVADSTRDALGMIGWAPYWELRRGPQDVLKFQVVHPGREYKLTMNETTRLVEVEERRKGFWSALNSLHGLTEIPNSPYATAWGVYTDFCTFSILFSALSGVYLWANSKRESALGWGLLASGAVASIGFMLFIIWRG